MRHLDLFSGIGGFALAARWAGWQTTQFVEIDQFCQKVISKNFPNIPIHGDIKTFEGTKLRGSVDVITGGFPCQPYSSAGKRKGKEDDRHLWPEMLRVIGEIQPAYIVGENVRGLLNWSGGLVFEEVQTDLEAKGYEVTSFLLPACSVNAPHERYRIWFVAYSAGNLGNYENRNEGHQPQEVSEERFNEPITTANPNRSERSKRRMYQERREETERHASTRHSRNDWGAWQNFPTQSPICRGNDGLPNRVDRIKSLGNAIVPQVAYEIFKVINDIRR